MKNIRSRRGQSIVEALVALSLLVVALLGIETLLARSFLLDRVTTDQTKATYLASEGVEIMKSLLDHQIYDAVANGVGGLANDPDAGGWPSFCGLSAGSFSYYQVDWKATSCPSSYAGNASAALTNADYLSFNKDTGL